MDKNLHDIENLFFRTLEDNEDGASDKVWNAIDQVLDKDSVARIQKKYSALRRLVLLSFFLLLCLGIYEWQSSYSIKGSSNMNRPFKAAGRNTTSTRNNGKTENSNEVVPSTRIQLQNKTILESSGNDVNIQKDIVPKLLQNITRDYIKTATDQDSSTRPHYQRVQQSIAGKRMYSQETKRTIIADANKGFVSLYEKNNNDQPSPFRVNSLSREKVDKIVPDALDVDKFLQSLTLIKVIQVVASKNMMVKNKKMNESALSRFSITPFFSPDLAFYHLQNDQGNNRVNSANEIENEERHTFSSTAGVLIDYRADKHWDVQSGLTFSDINIMVNSGTIYAQPDNSGNVKYLLNTSSGYGYILPSFASSPNIGDSLYASASIHTLHYVGIPLAAKYNVTKGKFNIYALAGASFNLLTMGKIETSVTRDIENETEVINSIQGLKKSYFSGTTSLGVDYSSNKKWALTFSPTYRFALNSINQGNAVKSYPKSLGLLFGLKIKL